MCEEQHHVVLTLIGPDLHAVRIHLDLGGNAWSGSFVIVLCR